MPHEELTWPWLVWLSNSALGLTMRRSLYLYPAAEIAHILGIVLLVGAAAMWDLRLLGVARRLSAAEVARYLLPWSQRGLVLVAISGAMMFTAHATEWAASPVFRVKLLLIALAGLNVLLFHRRIFRSVSSWDRDTLPPLAARVVAVASLVLWTTVVAAGRLLAYL